jgi:hypothetical protein
MYLLSWLTTPVMYLLELELDNNVCDVLAEAG